MEKLKSLLQFETSNLLYLKIETAAHDLLNNWTIQSGELEFEILEIEFFLYSEKLSHQDPYTTQAEVQKRFGHWYLHNGGAEITIGRDGISGSVQIRAVREVRSGAFYNGPQRVFRELFEDAGDILNPQGMNRLVRQQYSKATPVKILAAPRVGLNLSEFSKDLTSRIEYLMRPYRFIRTDTSEFADKYVALLYSDKVSNGISKLTKEDSIYQKYLKAFEIGRVNGDLEDVWTQNSKLLRLATLLGILQKKGRTLSPGISNEEVVDL